MSSNKIFSVAELNQEISLLLESSYPKVSVEGEISNLVKHGSGHWYFSLKDENAQVSCAMFKMNNRQVKLEVHNGLQVNVQAKVSLYAPRGNYQLIVSSMAQAGLGNLQLAFEKLKKKLFDEGLFDNRCKKPLPAYAKKIAVITSPTGAAIKDILTTCKRRFPLIPIDVYPCTVQGKDTAKSVIHSLNLAERHQQADIIIIARGGGSIEDLWGFNDENLARAIFQCPIPIISGVGHEIDTTMVDFVSDYKAPTPTGAAEIATPDRKITFQNINKQKTIMTRVTENKLHRLMQQNDILFHRLNSLNPKHRLSLFKNRTNDIYKQLLKANIKSIVHNKQQVKFLHQRLSSLKSHFNMVEKKRQILILKSQLLKAIDNILSDKSHAVNHQRLLLNSLSPKQVLTRGYTYVFSTKKQIIKTKKDLVSKKTAYIQFVDGHQKIQIQQDGS